ncbi:MAG TPA: hypothetical protein VGX23_32885 [Actinocrinis sp.]|nr:hypothetical protein [Actinocrinis sp.]
MTEESAAIAGYWWDGGVRADDLAAQLQPLVAELRVEQLGAMAELWGRPVGDERYALVAQI